MSLFQKFSSQKELSDFVEEYLQNRDELKRKMTEGRVGETAFIEDVERLQKPITDALTLEEDDDKTTLAQLQKEGNILQQKGNVKLDELKGLMSSLNVPNTIINTTISQGITNPLFQNTMRQIDNKDLDRSRFSLNFQSGRLLISKFNRLRVLSDSVLEIDFPNNEKKIYELSPNIIKFLVGNIQLINELVLNKNEESIIRQIYNKNIDGFKGSKSDKGKYIKNKILDIKEEDVEPTLDFGDSSSSQAGVGRNKVFKHKNVNRTGEFGNSIIDLGELIGSGRLKAYNKFDGKLTMSNKADSDLRDLILKKFNSYRKYNNRALELYRKLLEKSGIKDTGNKGALVDKKFSSLDPKIMSSPNKVMQRLENIIGSINAGNNNKNMLNEGSNIIDFLLQKKMISKKEHNDLFNKYFS